MIHFKNVRDVLNVLRDVHAYLTIQHRNDELGNKILSRVELILNDNDDD